MIHIDSSKTYQTMAGFGVTVPGHTQALSPIYGRPLYEQLIGDLGCSVMRTLLPTQDGKTPDGGLLEIQARDLADMASIKPGLKVIASIGAPPGVMRDESGSLKQGCEAEFAEYLLGLCGFFAQQGCPIDALGLQDGPTTAGSCRYDAESYYRMFKALYNSKLRRGDKVMLLAPEDECFIPSKVKNIVSRINADKEACLFLDILAVRGNVDTSWHSLMWARRENPAAKLRDLYRYVYRSLFDLVQPETQDVWVVHACGETPEWKHEVDYSKTVNVRDSAYMIRLPTGAMDLALKVSAAVNSGFSAYVYGLASTVPPVDEAVTTDFTDPTKALCDKGIKTKKYHAARHFFKYVAPGMVRIGASSDDAVVSAFKSDRIVVVAINDGNSILDTTVEIAGADVARYTSYTSVGNDFHAEESGVVTGNKIPVTMLPNSIVTFVAD